MKITILNRKHNYRQPLLMYFTYLLNVHKIYFIGIYYYS